MCNYKQTEAPAGQSGNVMGGMQVPQSEGVGRMRQVLYNKRARLQQELALVEIALKDLDDPVVQKTINIASLVEKESHR